MAASSHPQRRATLVVRALNEADHLPALFAGIQQQRIRPDEVVLVDSGSSDRSVAIAEAFGATIVHIAPEEFSFGRSLNVGCEAATGEILVFASAHVYPRDETWFERLIQPFEDSSVALSYGHQTGDDRSRFSELQLLRQWFPEQSNPDQRTPFCNNANCAIRKSWWERFKYDEELTGLEDLAWAKAVLKEGGRLVYRADASVAHIHDEDYASVRNRYRREAIAHRRIFDDQRLGIVEAFALFIASVARDYLAALSHRVVLRNLADIPLFRGAQFLGTWEGFRSRGEASIELKRHFYYPEGFSARTARRPNAAKRAS